MKTFLNKSISVVLVIALLVAVRFVGKAISNSRSVKEASRQESARLERITHMDDLYGKQIAAVSLTDSDGHVNGLPSPRHRYQLLILFSPNCDACTIGSIYTEQIYEQLASRLDVLGVSTGNLKDLRDFKARLGLRYPVCSGDQRLFDEFGAYGTPTYIVLDPSGKVIYAQNDLSVTTDGEMNLAGYVGRLATGHPDWEMPHPCAVVGQSAPTAYLNVDGGAQGPFRPSPGIKYTFLFLSPDCEDCRKVLTALNPALRRDLGKRKIVLVVDAPDVVEARQDLVNAGLDEQSAASSNLVFATDVGQITRTAFAVNLDPTLIALGPDSRISELVKGRHVADHLLD